MIARNRLGKTVVVIGNGMVGHRFCERLVEYDLDQSYQIVTFCEEPRPAYDRVNLSKYFERREADAPAVAAQAGEVLLPGRRQRDEGRPGRSR